MSSVQDGPVVTRTRAYPVSEAAVPGTTVTLLCAIDANPIELSRIRWLKNDQEVAFSQWEQRFEGTDATLISKSIRREDAGQYACEIENAYGTSRATLPLIVQCKCKKHRMGEKSLEIWI